MGYDADMNRLVWLLGAVAFAYFAVTVPLGKRTLWGHLVRIAKTPEAQDLADGAKETARDVARKAQKEIDDQRREKPEPLTQ